MVVPSWEWYRGPEEHKGSESIEMLHLELGIDSEHKVFIVVTLL